MLRISLRELLILVALVAVAIVSLKYASDVWLAAVVGLMMLAFFAALIVAAVDRGPRQAFAIGFALTMAGYWLIVLTGNKTTPNQGSLNVEFDHMEGRLPTTRLLRYVHKAMDHGKWYDYSGKSPKEIPNYDPAKDPNRSATGGGFGGGGFPVGGGGMRRLMSYQESLPRELFMRVGHCWWGLLLGYLGGKFAAFVYSRRLREQKSLAT